MKKEYAALFVRKDSIYKTFSNVDCYDINRNALILNNDLPVIAHPPCRAWGRLRQFAKPVTGEKALALFAVGKVRRNGGVLEHPAYSSLWKYADLPTGSQTDKYGGFTLMINQHWFGHKAEKKTFLYIVGISRAQLPEYSLNFDRIDYVVSSSKKCTGKKELSKADRERTPLLLAKYLIDICKKVTQNKNEN